MRFIPPGCGSPAGRIAGIVPAGVKRLVVPNVTEPVPARLKSRRSGADHAYPRGL